MSRFFFHIILLTLVLFLGCSRVDNNPSAPLNPSNSILAHNSNLGIMVDTVDSYGNPIGGAGVLGLFSVNVDIAKMSGELIPLRKVFLDDTLEMVDITNFLQLAPCIDCIKLFNIEMDPDGHIALSIGIKHPFEAIDPRLPHMPTGRLDFHVFNVEGTVIFDDSSGSTSFTGLGETAGQNLLINADGYSPYLDPVLDDIFPTSATLHPYILHFDDYTQGNFNPSIPTGFESLTIPGPSGNLVMPRGSDYDKKQYLFDIPDGESFDFIFAVGCTYAVSSSDKTTRMIPEYQIPQHNKKAASEVHVEVASNLLVPGDSNSTCELLIKVLDINHGVPIGDQLDQMLADSSVGNVYVEVPGVTSGAIEGSSTPTGGDGRDPSNPLTFSLTFRNDLAATQGSYLGLVKIKDNYPVGQNSFPLLNGQDAIKRVDPLQKPPTGLYSLNEFATYMVFDVDIT